jgi:hypothetical protein
MFTTLIENQAQSRNTKHVDGVGFLCSTCWVHKPIANNGFGTGYGVDNSGLLHCYECCGKKDAENMKTNSKHFGYLSKDKDDAYWFGNWCGTLKIRIHGVSKSFHNFAGRDGRRDFWFTAYGKNWHGVNIGDNECATVKALKH